MIHSKKEISNLKNLHFTSLDYIDILRLNLVERRLQIPSCPAASSDGKASFGYQPPPLTSAFGNVDKQQLIVSRRSRFGR
jgi:hypothetical protein